MRFGQVLRPEGWSLLALVAFHVTHYLSVAVWVGTMFFNLIVGFPLMKKRADTVRAHVDMMAAQGVRAAPWLYLLVTSTLASGWLIALVAPPSATFLMVKHALFFGMLACHLYGTLVMWPKIIFSLDSEVPALFRRYKLLMIGSTALGVLAISSSYYWVLAN